MFTFIEMTIISFVVACCSAFLPFLFMGGRRIEDDRKAGTLCDIEDIIAMHGNGSLSSEEALEMIDKELMSDYARDLVA